MFYRQNAGVYGAGSLIGHDVEWKLELLGQASVVARQIGEPAMKAFQLGQTAERLLDAGQREQASSPAMSRPRSVRPATQRRTEPMVGCP